MRTIVLIIIIGFHLVGAIGTIRMVGKTRKPVTGELAAATMITTLVLTGGAIYLYVS
jgi:hypothetical protein